MCLPYDYLLSQKFILKIYRTDRINYNDKKLIYSRLIKTHADNILDLQNYIIFTEKFFVILDEIYEYIKIEIINSFENSLFLFLYTLGKYMNINLDLLLFPKKLIHHIAAEVLNDDTNWGELQSKILFAESKYYEKNIVIKKIYKKAIEYGCIYEKYDDLSYSRIFISDVTCKIKPTVRFFLKNPEYEMGIRLGELFDELQFEGGMEKEAETIHHFYKCKICKYCYLTNRNEDEKEIMLIELNRQFNHMTFTDRIYFLTGNIPSYILSILGYLYTELVKLIILSQDTYCKIKITDIKREMCFNEGINTQEFSICMDAIFSKQKIIDFNKVIPFFRYENEIIIARWMYNYYFSIVEESKNIALNAKKNSRFGKEADYFGKKYLRILLRK